MHGQQGDATRGECDLLRALARRRRREPGGFVFFVRHHENDVPGTKGLGFFSRGMLRVFGLAAAASSWSKQTRARPDARHGLDIKEHKSFEKVQLHLCMHWKQDAPGLARLFWLCSAGMLCTAMLQHEHVLQKSVSTQPRTSLPKLLGRPKWQCKGV